MVDYFFSYLKIIYAYSCILHVDKLLCGIFCIFYYYLSIVLEIMNNMSLIYDVTKITACPDPG